MRTIRGMVMMAVFMLLVLTVVKALSSFLLGQ